MIIAASLMASKLTHEEHDIPAAGFAVLTVAMAYGFVATHDTGAEQFGAVIAIFVPGLIQISFYSIVPLFYRICGFISAASFASLSILIFLDVGIEAARIITTISGYMGLNISLLGWAWLVF